MLDDGEHDCVEQGFLMVPVALRCLAELSTPLGQGLALCDRALLDALERATPSGPTHLASAAQVPVRHWIEWLDARL